VADAKVGKRYAQALFNAAKAADVVTSVEADLNAVANQFENDERFREFLVSPHVGRDEKLQILEKIFSDRITALTMSALRLMLQKRRENELEAVREEFVRLRREFQKKVYVLVSSAERLTDGQMKMIESKLEKLSGADIEPEFRIDPALIGGVRVSYGDYVLDGTVRGALRRLRDRLRIDVLKQSV
jgi:F-type H+-transporting ATPase subunit delta